MKGTKKFLMLCVVMMSYVVECYGVVDKYYYRDCEVKLHSPSSAKGIVYVDFDPRANDVRASDNPTLQTKPGQTATIQARFRGTANSAYKCLLLAYPNPGYAVKGFVSQKNYLAGNTSEAYFLKDEKGYKIRSGEAYDIAKVDTTVDVWDNSMDRSRFANYRFSAKTTVEVTAVIEKSYQLIVTVNAPGQLKAEVEKSHNPKGIDELVIKGPLNYQDFRYMKTLYPTRLDLSKARFDSIPYHVFAFCYNLQEVKLPESGLKVIQDEAFKDCHCLKAFKIPAGVNVELGAFQNCVSWSLDLPQSGIVPIVTTTKTSSQKQKETKAVRYR